MANRRPIDLLRGGWRLLGLACVGLAAVAGFAFCRRHRVDALSRARWLQQLCGQALSVLGVGVRSSGAPPGGALIAANHLGYLDILVLAALAPVVFVAKKEVRGWPVFGWFAARAGTRFIDRGKLEDVVRVGEELAPLIAGGVSVLVFLEGTSSDGSGVLPFKPSLLQPAVVGGWPVAPAALHYEVPAGRDVVTEVYWWGDMTLTPHLLNFTTLPRVESRVAWGPVREPPHVDRKSLAEALRLDVVALRLRAQGIESEAECSSTAS